MLFIVNIKHLLFKPTMSSSDQISVFNTTVKKQCWLCEGKLFIHLLFSLAANITTNVNRIRWYFVHHLNISLIWADLAQALLVQVTLAESIGSMNWSYRLKFTTVWSLSLADNNHLSRDVVIFSSALYNQQSPRKTHPHIHQQKIATILWY